MWRHDPPENQGSAANGSYPLAKRKIKYKKIAESLTTGDMPRQSPVAPRANGIKICSNNGSMGIRGSKRKP